MRPIPSSSRSQNQVAAANIINREDNQQPGTAFARTVSEAYGNASATASTEEQAADGADTPPNTGLVARTITETQALPVRSEPMSQSTIMAITAGRFNPLALAAIRRIRNPVIEDLQIPEGRHTYQPYFWLSKLAHRQMAPPLTKQTADMQYQVIGQLLMSEGTAKQEFHERFEYRLVDYGYTSLDVSGMPEKNYGVFAIRPVAKGALLGIYSGIGYLIRSESWAKTNCDWRPEHLHRQFSEEMPDLMSCYRTLAAGLRGKEQTQRTPTKYGLAELTVNPSNRINIVPDNERYTPMHFINSANEPEDANTTFDLITVNTGSDNFHIPICVATREIAAGQELMLSYYTNATAEKKRAIALNGAEEKAKFDIILTNYLRLINKLNRAEPGRPPISPIVAAPVICISEIIRKTFRGKVAKRHQPSGIDASGD